MRNQTQAGNVITVTAPYTVAAGAGCKAGSFFGVATSAASSGAAVELALTGIYDITCLSTDTPAFGAKLYWDDTNKRLTTTSSTHMLVGAYADRTTKVDGATTASVRLNGIAA
jgi:predicted RecA/RadA family phage recombinase